MSPKRTGVFATEGEIASLKAAMSTPYIIVGGVAPPNPQHMVHAYALAHGLPEIRGYYGCDLTTGEFLES